MAVLGGMKMEQSSISALFCEVLDRQEESGSNINKITADRFYEAFTRGPKLNASERQLLMLSPVLRYQCVDVLNQINQEIKSSLEQSQIPMSIVPLAAASDSDKYHFSCIGFDVYLYDQSEMGVPWIILLQLNRKVMEALHPMSRIRLYDSGGKEWLQGVPDQDGQIMQEFLNDETNFSERSKMYSLHIEPF